MPLISQEEAMQAIEPHRAGLFDIATSPWDSYHAQIPDDLLVVFCSRTRASAVHNLMVASAARYAASTAGVRPFERQLMRGITIGGRFAIRFKKLDEEGNSSGHYTRQVEEFRNQEVLDGIEAVHHLELGYVLNKHETEIAEVRIVCPSGRGVAWSSRIDRKGIEPVVVDLLPKEPNPPQLGGAIIKPKETGIVIPLRRQEDES